MEKLSKCCGAKVSLIFGDLTGPHHCLKCRRTVDVTAMTHPTPKQDSQTIELFRAALMEKHSDDWDMETISEAAHICAATIEAYCVERERKLFKSLHKRLDDRFRIIEDIHPGRGGCIDKWELQKELCEFDNDLHLQKQSSSQETK